MTRFLKKSERTTARNHTEVYTLVLYLVWFVCQAHRKGYWILVGRQRIPLTTTSSTNTRIASLASFLHSVFWPVEKTKASPQNTRPRGKIFAIFPFIHTSKYVSHEVCSHNTNSVDAGAAGHREGKKNAVARSNRNARVDTEPCSDALAPKRRTIPSERFEAKSQPLVNCIHVFGDKLPVIHVG